MAYLKRRVDEREEARPVGAASRRSTDRSSGKQLYGQEVCSHVQDGCAQCRENHDGWMLTFALEDGDFPVHISMAKIVSCVGTAASDEDVRAVLEEHAEQLGSIAESMRRAAKSKYRL